MHERPGSLIIGSGPSLDAAFNALLEGCRLAAHTDALLPHFEILLGALDQAGQTQEGALFLAHRPRLGRQLAAYRRKLIRLSRASKRRRSAPHVAP